MNAAALPASPVESNWQNFRSRVLFKFILPRLQRAELEGVKLDISMLTPLMKNTIRTGRYEMRERQQARQLLTKDDTVLELGAAIGFIGLYCRKVIGVKHHFSVESNAEAIEVLKQNYVLNELEPDAIHAAAGAKDGSVTLDVKGELWNGLIIDEASSSKAVSVPAYSLRSLIGMMPAKPTAFLCGIGGAEQQLDFTQLPSSVTKVIIKLHPEIIGQMAVNAILSLLSAMGFRERSHEAGTWLLVRQG